MITVLLDDPIICDLPIKVIKIDEFLSNFDCFWRLLSCALTHF